MGIWTPAGATKKLWLPNYGNGSDGSPASGNLTLGALKQYVNYTLDNGHTWTLTQGIPSVVRCQGTLTISGAVNCDSKGYMGGSAPGSNGAGPGGGGGAPAATPYGGGGGGAAHVTQGTNGNTGSSGSLGAGSLFTYPSLGELLAAVAVLLGSGGGAGGQGQDGSVGLGGYGGGAFLGFGRRIVLNSTANLHSTGGSGGNGTGHSGAGAPGTGGLIVLFADDLVLPATGTQVSALAGVPGTTSGYASEGGYSSVGRVYLIYTRSITAGAASRCNPTATVINLATLPVPLG